MKSLLLSTDDFVALTGITHRQIGLQCDAGVFGGANRDPGSGGRRRFDAVDVKIGLALSVLGDFGGILAATDQASRISTQLGHKVAQAVRVKPGGRWLVVDPDGLVSITDEPAMTLPGVVLVDLWALKPADLLVDA